jgi:hypothetical protein
MSKVIHMDSERGAGSIKDLIAAGRVDSYDCSTFEKAENVYWAIVHGRIKGDLVVMDTVSTLVDRHVRDSTLDPDLVKPASGKTWWSQRKLMRTSQDVWGIVNFGVLNLLTGIRELPIPSIFLVHETERDDPTADGEVTRHLPGLPPKILKTVMAISDLSLRLYKTPIGFTDPKTGKPHPANTRMLQIENTASAYTGVRLTPEADAALPDYIVEPTLEKLAIAIGSLPKALTVYGFPKVGKTVFGCTLPV